MTVDDLLIVRLTGGHRRDRPHRVGNRLRTAPP